MPITRIAIAVGLLAAATAAGAASSPEVIEIQTNVGTIAVRLNYAKAPITTDNFMAYVDSGFYKGTLMHRTVKNFVVQGGGISKTDGKIKVTNPPIINESTNGLSNLTGTIAMARTNDPNSATSQFFINLADNTNLDYQSAISPGYAVFGKVVKGMSIADKIEALANYNEVAFTSNAQLVWIETVYKNANWDTTVARTRILRNGSGTVVSDPPGISCGSTCSISQAKGDALKLTATPAAGYAFTGWRGDCSGVRTVLNIDTNKGNHNCTAVFTALGAALQ
jgi:uncharacterized repeat protein (TIGR02543 family)